MGSRHHEGSSKRSRRTIKQSRRSFPAWRRAQHFSFVRLCCCGCCCCAVVLLFFWCWSATNGVWKEQKTGNTHPSTLLLSEKTTVARHNRDNPQQQQQLIIPSAAHHNKNHSNKKTAAVAVFHEARADRSGATIHDMLLAHAYAFSQNQTYGGACFARRQHQKLDHLHDHLEMIAALGLGHVLRFACPEDGDDNAAAAAAGGGVGGNAAAAAASAESVWIDRHLYTRFGTRLWTPEWLEHIRGLQQRGVVDDSSSSPKTLADNSDPKKQQHNDSRRRRRRVVVAHIRRGDVDLCDPATRDRYLTNRHYRNLIDQYASSKERDDEVTIFSERNSTERWDDFADCCDLQLDQPPARAWRAMMEADVLILSKSSFSIVPALFNRKKGGVIVYTPFWVEPLAHWIRVDDDADRAERRAQIRLRHQLCDGNNNDNNHKR